MMKASPIHHAPSRQLQAQPLCRFVAPARRFGFKAEIGTGRSRASIERRSSSLLCSSAVTSEAPTQPEQPEVEKVKVDSISTHEVVPGVQLIRGNCRSRLKYEVEYNLKRGTTDNSYLLKAPGASVLVDIPLDAFADQFASAVKSLTPLSELTHVVLTQLDPKSIPSLEALLAAAVQERGSAVKIQVVLSNPAARLLQSAMGDKPERAALLSSIQVQVARSGVTVPVGSAGEELELLVVPTPRWPDMLVAYHPGKRLMFCSKLFSAHVAPSVAAGVNEGSAMDVGGWDVYGEDWRHYFECMVAPQARQALPALNKLDIVPAPQQGGVKPGGRGGALFSELGAWMSSLLRSSAPAVPAAPRTEGAISPVEGPRSVSSLLPMHGPVVSSALAQLTKEYRSWTEAQVQVASTSCVVVMYASAYGNTTALAQAISRGITRAGVAVEMMNLETAGVEEINKAISSGSGFIIGSPTLGGHMPSLVQVALGSVMRNTEATLMPCGVFGSFGWSGEAVDEMEQRLKDAGFKFAFKPIRVKFRPTAKDLQVCEESGRELAVAIKRKSKAREASVSAGDSKVAMASAPTLAMGRVVGSLTVLAAKDEDASSAMLASWVSQASFNPPGLTISVKKDRAMEPLLVIGGKFAVSTVPEGGADRLVMKRLARSFQPGEDRLAGLETFEGELTGAPILKVANACLECQVVSRMEAGDHWLIYATVLGGKVLDEGALTAVHHRKVGNHY